MSSSARAQRSRRSFLVVAGTGLSGAAVALLAACGASSAAISGSRSAAATAPATASAASTSSAATRATTTAAAISSATGAASSAAAANVVVPTPTPAPPVYGKGNIGLLFLNGLGGADGETMKGMLTNYAKENPGVSIDFQTLGWPQVFAKLDSTLAAGTPPELVIMHATEIPEYAVRKALQPVDDWFAKGLLPKSDWSQTILDKATWDGKMQSIPLDIHDVNSYVSTDMVKRYGIDPNNLPVGKDLISALQQVSHNPKDPATGTFGMNLWSPWPEVAFIWQFGGDVLSPDGKQVTLNTQPVIDAMQMVSDVIYKYQIVPDPHIKFTLPEAKDLERIAVQVGASWDLNTFKHAGVAPPAVVPALLPQLGTVKKQTWMNSHELTIPVGVSGTKYDEAKKLIVWISDHNVDWAQSGQPPARTSAQNSPVLDQPWAWEVQAFAKITSQYGRYEISPPGFTQISAIYDNAISDVLNNKGAVKEILDKYAAQMKGLMAQLPQ